MAVATCDGEVAILFGAPHERKAVRRARAKTAPDLERLAAVEPRQVSLDGPENTVQTPVGDASVQAGQFQGPAEAKTVAERGQRNLPFAQQDRPPRRAARRVHRDGVALGGLQRQADIQLAGALRRPCAGGDDDLAGPEMAARGPNLLDRAVRDPEAHNLGLCMYLDPHVLERPCELGDEAGNMQVGAFLVVQGAADRELSVWLERAYVPRAEDSQRYALGDHLRHGPASLLESLRCLEGDQHASCRKGGSEASRCAEFPQDVQAPFLHVEQHTEAGLRGAVIAGAAEMPKPAQ